MRLAQRKRFFVGPVLSSDEAVVSACGVVFPEQAASARAAAMTGRIRGERTSISF